MTEILTTVLHLAESILTVGRAQCHCQYSGPRVPRNQISLVAFTLLLLRGLSLHFTLRIVLYAIPSLASEALG